MKTFLHLFSFVLAAAAVAATAADPATDAPTNVTVCDIVREIENSDNVGREAGLYLPRAGGAAAIYVPGWCRNGGDSAQELALLAEAFPGARCEARTWEGDGVDFWACRDEADAEGRRFGAMLAALPEEKP